MTWDNHTCDDCGAQTSGGPVLRDELWGTITTPYAVVVPWVPDQPDQLELFPCFQRVDSFLCFACIERRLDRQLVQEDLATAPWNAGWIDMDTLRDELRMRDPDASDAFKEMNEKWMARRAPGRRLLPHTSDSQEGTP